MTNSKHTFVPSFTFVLVHMSYSAAAMLVNVTVDDSAPDPRSGESIIYSPYNDWSIGQNCSTCLARPDASMIYDNSWHDHTYGSPLPSSNQFGSATFYFVGSAVYIYGVLGGGQSNFISATQLSLSIDGKLLANFSYTPQDSVDFIYNALFFSVESLEYGPHTLALQNGLPGGQPSLILLDYIVYTAQVDSDKSSSSLEPTRVQTATATSTSGSSASSSIRYFSIIPTPSSSRSTTLTSPLRPGTPTSTMKPAPSQPSYTPPVDSAPSAKKPGSTFIAAISLSAAFGFFAIVYLLVRVRRRIRTTGLSRSTAVISPYSASGFVAVSKLRGPHGGSDPYTPRLSTQDSCETTVYDTADSRISNTCVIDMPSQDGAHGSIEPLPQSDSRVARKLDSMYGILRGLKSKSS